ncbi:MAG TPA: XRE family transcriptional regulator [Terrisporobacter glycolicus]|uniref:helix-turn-helix domain-containing protein n=1 Tax=Terrisporobacter TaxID=1505652 RepID=UPI000E8E9384|nr:MULTISPECIES: helix-turn-helix transcriptional regulator [Terrisporobacter]HBI91170.1 XRE family transcriptional regulator [Terrisporobacter hibernicus]
MLKNARKKQKITQKELAEMTKISQSYISKLEMNKFVHSPTIAYIIDLAQGLHLNVYDLAKYFIDKELEYRKDGNHE